MASSHAWRTRCWRSGRRRRQIDPSQARAVGHHVEGQQQDGQDLQQPAQELRGERDRVVGQRAGQLPLVDAVDEVAEVERRREVAVDEVLHLGDPRRQVVDEVGHLAGDEAHRWHRRRAATPSGSRTGRPPSPPPGASPAGPRKLTPGSMAKREEQRDGKEEQQRVQAGEQPPADERGDEAQPEHHDRPQDPSRHGRRARGRLDPGSGPSRVRVVRPRLDGRNGGHRPSVDAGLLRPGGPSGEGGGSGGCPPRRPVISPAR